MGEVEICPPIECPEEGEILLAEEEPSGDSLAVKWG